MQEPPEKTPYGFQDGYQAANYGYVEENQVTTVVVQQPQSASSTMHWSPPHLGWMPPAPLIHGSTPPGTENLASLDEVFVKQYIDAAEVITGIHFANRYSILNRDNQVVLTAVEESDVCSRFWCQMFRGFTMHIMDRNGLDVILLQRRFKCCAGCCWCSSPGNGCSFDIFVECPPGNPVGSIKQERYCCAPYFGIYDANNQFVSAIRGPCCPCICPCFSLDYKVSPDRPGREVNGQIQRVWGGWCHDYCTNADDYVLTFPPGADVSMKALMIGASIILDFIFFENRTN